MKKFLLFSLLISNILVYSQKIPDYWGNPITISGLELTNISEKPQQFKFISYDDGRLFSLFLKEDEFSKINTLYYSLSDKNLSWSTAQVVPNIDEFDEFKVVKMFVNSEKLINVFCYSKIKSALIYFTFDGFIFSEPRYVLENIKYKNPSFSITQTNDESIHIIWNDFADKTIEVFYAEFDYIKSSIGNAELLSSKDSFNSLLTRQNKFVFNDDVILVSWFDKKKNFNSVVLAEKVGSEKWNRNETISVDKNILQTEIYFKDLYDIKVNLLIEENKKYIIKSYLLDISNLETEKVTTTILEDKEVKFILSYDFEKFLIASEGFYKIIQDNNELIFEETGKVFVSEKNEIISIAGEDNYLHTKFYPVRKSVESFSGKRQNDLIKDDSWISSYPNPTINNVTISFKCETESEYEVEIFNILGEKQVAEKRVFSRGTGNVKFELNDFLPGIYFYTVIGNGKIATGKLIKVE